MKANPKSASRLIDREELLRRVPVTFMTIYNWMRDGKFPMSRDIGGKVAWVETEVQAWIDARPKSRLKGGQPEATSP
jgi:prophage regulatory protein